MYVNAEEEVKPTGECKQKIKNLLLIKYNKCQALKIVSPSNNQKKNNNNNKISEKKGGQTVQRPAEHQPDGWTDIWTFAWTN